MRSQRSRALILVAGGALSAFGCSSLIGLGSLDRVSCLGECAGSTAAAGASGTGVSSTDAGAPDVAGSGASGGSSATFGGTLNDGGSAATAGAGTVITDGGSAGEVMPQGGTGGAPTPKSVCPGGVEPVLTWQEHWFEHNLLLTRVSYDDCSAVYFDKNMDPKASAWLSPFVSSAWAYSVKTYGSLGPERVYAVFHQGTYSGGHVGLYTEALHDFHNVEDAGATDWTQPQTQNFQDYLLVLFSFIVESTAQHSKTGSPAATVWQIGPWSEFYKYDTYVGLGSTAQASAALTKFNKSSYAFPRASTFWFRDWFYPLWRDHGHAQVMANFYGLLEKYYRPLKNATDGMNMGEFVHFSSGAAHTNLKPLATAAFGWTADSDAQFIQAETDYPSITY